MRFHPCIDLHEGRVKQIVGKTLDPRKTSDLQTNFVSEKSAEFYANLYKRHGLTDGHVVMLGPNNQEAALSALKAYPKGLRVGGGIQPEDAENWLQNGAKAVIVSSGIFENGKFDRNKAAAYVRAVGKKHVVLDLSCRKIGDTYQAVTEKWTKVTDLKIDAKTFDQLSEYSNEFLIHATDVEGSSSGINRELIEILSKFKGVSITYAGGIASRNDLDFLEKVGQGKIHFTIGSGLDIFGGRSFRFLDLADKYA